MKTFIPKDDQRLPDYFTIKITYITGKEETIDVVSIRHIGDTYNKGFKTGTLNAYEIWTKDDIMLVRNKDTIVGIDYDKNWSKIVAIQEEQLMKEANDNEKSKTN